MSHRALIALIAAVLLVCPLVAAGQDLLVEKSIPLEESKFTALIVQQLRDSAGANVQITGKALALKLTARSGVAVDANLSELHRYCVAVTVEGRCAEAVRQYVQAALEVFGEGSEPVERTMLHPMVLTAGYVQSQARSDNLRGLPAAIARPLIGELWTVLAIRRGLLLRVATTDTLKELGLDESGAFELALQNVKALKEPILERAQPFRGSRFELLGEDVYEPSRLLMHADWADVAKARGGELIVSAPASNAVVFGAGKTPQDIQALRELAADVVRIAPRPLTTQIFRWRPDRWELVPDQNHAGVDELQAAQK